MDYILNTQGGLRIDFPQNRFGYNKIEYELVKAKNPEMDEKELKSFIRPFPRLKFKNGRAVVTDKKTIELAIKNKDVSTLAELIERPWPVEMIRETNSYKDQEIWELSKEHQDQIRRDDGSPSLIPPEDFHERKEKYEDQIEFIKQEFSFDFKDEEKLKNQCDEYLLTLQKVRDIYRIVNIAIPKEQMDLKRYSKSLEACRVLIEILFEDSGY